MILGATRDSSSYITNQMQKLYACTLYEVEWNSDYRIINKHSLQFALYMQFIGVEFRLQD